MIDPGKMRDRITIQRAATVEVWIPGEDGEDGYFDTQPAPPIDLATVWAVFRPTTGREFRSQAVAQKIGESKAVFSINYREDIRQADWIVHRGRGGNRVWNIQSVIPIGFKDGTDIQCVNHDSTPRAP